MSRYYNDNILHTGIMDEDEILHYGVKGMKWRKRRNSLAKKLYSSAAKNDYKAYKAETEATKASFKQADHIANNKAYAFNGRMGKYRNMAGNVVTTQPGYDEKKYKRHEKDKKRAISRQRKHQLISKAKKKLAKIIGG